MKKTQIALTAILALIWVAIIVLGTLSPLAQSDNVGNQFGDFGMWSAIVFILLLFFLPLIFYVKGSKKSFIILAVIIGIFIIGAIVIGATAVSSISGFNIPLASIVFLSGAYLVLSIVWFVSSIKRVRR